MGGGGGTWRTTHWSYKKSLVLEYARPFGASLWYGDYFMLVIKWFAVFYHMEDQMEMNYQNMATPNS